MFRVDLRQRQDGSRYAFVEFGDCQHVQEIMASGPFTLDDQTVSGVGSESCSVFPWLVVSCLVLSWCLGRVLFHSCILFCFCIVLCLGWSVFVRMAPIYAVMLSSSLQGKGEVGHCPPVLCLVRPIACAWSMDYSRRLNPSATGKIIYTYWK